MHPLVLVIVFLPVAVQFPPQQPEPIRLDLSSLGGLPVDFSLVVDETSIVRCGTEIIPDVLSREKVGRGSISVLNFTTLVAFNPLNLGEVRQSYCLFNLGGGSVPFLLFLLFLITLSLH